jgi:hypothetical protein
MVETEAWEERLSLCEEKEETEDTEVVVEIDAKDERARDRWGAISNGAAIIARERNIEESIS